MLLYYANQPLLKEWDLKLTNLSKIKVYLLLLYDALEYRC